MEKIEFKLPIHYKNAKSSYIASKSTRKAKFTHGMIVKRKKAGSSKRRLSLLISLDSFDYLEQISDTQKVSYSVIVDALIERYYKMAFLNEIKNVDKIEELVNTTPMLSDLKQRLNINEKDEKGIYQILDIFGVKI